MQLGLYSPFPCCVSEMFLWFHEPKLDSASLCALSAAQAPGAISRALLAAEHNPLVWFMCFKSHCFGSSLTRRRFCKLTFVIPQFKQKKKKIYYKSHELLSYLKAIDGGIKAPCYPPSPCCDEADAQHRSHSGRFCLYNSSPQTALQQSMDFI